MRSNFTLLRECSTGFSWSVLLDIMWCVLIRAHVSHSIVFEKVSDSVILTSSTSFFRFFNVSESEYSRIACHFLTEATLFDFDSKLIAYASSSWSSELFFNTQCSSTSSILSGSDIRLVRWLGKRPRLSRDSQIKPHVNSFSFLSFFSSSCLIFSVISPDWVDSYLIHYLFAGLNRYSKTSFHDDADVSARCLTDDSWR